MADDDTKDDTPEESEDEKPEGAGDEKDQQAADSGGETPEGAGAETPEGAEGETPEDAGDEDSEPARGIRGMLTISRTLIVAGAAALLVGGGGAALVFTGALDTLIGGGSKRATVALPEPPVYYEFPPLLVDLKTGRCRSPFIKLRAVALVSEPDMARLQELEPQVLDAFQAFLRDHERRDLVGKEGTDKLRQGFLSILNTAMEPARARNVLFREILLQ